VGTGIGSEEIELSLLGKNEFKSVNLTGEEWRKPFIKKRCKVGGTAAGRGQTWGTFCEGL